MELAVTDTTLAYDAKSLLSILDNLADGVVVADQRAMLVYFNPAAERILGLGLTETPASEWARRYGVLLPDGVTPCPADMLPLVRAVRGEASDEVELIVRNDRTPPEGVCISVTGRPLLDEWGAARGGVVVFRDITARRKAEEALRKSEHLLELFFSQSLDGFFFMMLEEPVRWDDTVGKDAVLEYVFSHQRITKVNDAMLAQYGATREQFIGLTPRDLYKHDIAYGKAGWRRFFDAGHLHTETDERRLDGTPIHIEGDYICLYDAEGRITGHFGIQRDVTERHRAEEARRLSEEKFAKAFHSSPMRVSISTLKDGRLIEVNDTFLRDLGLTRDQVLGRTAFELGLYANPADRERLVEALIEHGTIREFEFEGHLRNGQREVTLLSADVIQFDGEPCVLAVAYDITERKRAEDRVRRSRRELRALAARLQSVREEERRRIAHEIHDELGQALTGLKIDLAWLAGRLPGSQPELAQHAASVIARVDETISAVRRISTELRPSVLDHLGLVAAVEWQASELEKRTGIRVSLDLPPDAIVLDDSRATNVFRILQETLTNVVRHAQATRVAISLAVQGADLTLEVRDNGRGITEEELNGTRSLGLVGLRERAVACGGKLHVHGAPGEGTTVALRIPLRLSTETRAVR